MRRNTAAILGVLGIMSGCATGSGQLAQDAALVDTDWVEVDLAIGAVSAVAAPEPRQLAGARWRTSHMLFRRIPAADASWDPRLLPGGGEPEDHTGAHSGGRSYLAVFELTTAQWAVMHGASGSGSDDHPLTGVPAGEIADAVAALTLQRWQARLPDADLWAVGCNGGSASLFSWGDGWAETAASTYAVHHPRSGSFPTGTAAVGSLAPNSLGLFDMHGNAWELVRSGAGFAARGGGWDSPVMQCRTANTVPVPADLATPSLGVRLALSY